jgi:hypothetical protein
MGSERPQLGVSGHSRVSAGYRPLLGGWKSARMRVLPRPRRRAPPPWSAGRISGVGGERKVRFEALGQVTRRCQATILETI